MKMKSKMLGALGTVLLLGSNLYAQEVADGQAALGEVATGIQGYYESIAQIIYALAAIIALVGAIRIYMQWNSGDKDIGKMIIGWFGACIFLVAIGAIIEAFFGVA